jgi:hypothetical protein
MTENEFEILRAFKRRWDASPLARLVPGGLWYGRVPDSAASPYARITLQSERPQWTSGRDYTQEVNVTISVWNLPGAGLDAFSEIVEALSSTYDYQERFFPLSGGRRCLWLEPQTSEIQQDGSQDAQPVLVASGSWRVLLQATRRNR